MGPKAAEDDRPSSARRQHLRSVDAKESNIPIVSSFFPLDRYYAASDKVLESFEEAFARKSLDEAYVYGMRYCTFCVEGIVNHDYYRSSRFEKRRNQTNDRVNDVLTKLEQVANWMDAEEIEKEKRRRLLIEKQRKERERIQREKEAKQIAELEARIAQQKQSTSVSESGNLEESAMAKLARLSQPIPPPQQPTPTPPQQPKRVSLSDASESATTSNGHASVQPLPPPMLPPGEDEDGDAIMSDASQLENGAPPSYHQILGQSKNYFGQQRHPDSSSSIVTPAETSSGPTIIPPTEPALPSYDSVVKHKPKKPKAPSHNIRQYISQCRQRHQQYLQERKIQISPVKTYQGRVGGSTNGCTVISACIVSKHLETHGGVTDAQIVSVIDRDCVPLLRNIRSKLGLTGGALIIPSDVHDHLVDHKWLWQHKFVGAAGGNIVDPSHLGEFLDLLKGEPNKTQHIKAAATLFFREHVISIVKFPTSPTEAIYDMIDSLPTCNGTASRTRCMSLDALKVHLEKYTTQKFSDSNCTYIERNRWDDTMADFDPRVFQAFVWADLPKPAE